MKKGCAMTLLRKIRDVAIVLMAVVGLGQFAWSQGQYFITTLTGSEIVTVRNAGPYPVGVTTQNLAAYVLGSSSPTANVFSGLLSSPSATPGTLRDVRGEISVGTAAAPVNMTAGNLVGVRGGVTVPTGSTVSNYADYLYGAQGKAILPGNVTAANIAGLMGQWDISATTLGASGSSLSVAWLDAGATASASAVSNLPGNDSSILRMTNTTSAATAQIIESVANAAVFMALSANGLAQPAYVQATNTSCGSAGAVTASKALAVTIGGTPYYIPLCPTI